MICAKWDVRLDGSDGSSYFLNGHYVSTRFECRCIYKAVECRHLIESTRRSECRHLIGSTRRFFHSYRNKGVSRKFILNVDGVSTRHMNVDGDLQGIKLCPTRPHSSVVGGVAEVGTQRVYLQ